MVSYSQCREVAMHMDPLPHRPWWWRLLGISYWRAGDMLGPCRGVADEDYMRGVTVTAPIPINLIYATLVWVWIRLKRPGRRRSRTAHESMLLRACQRLRRERDQAQFAEGLIAREMVTMDMTAVLWVVFEPAHERGGACRISVQRRDGSQQQLEIDADNTTEPHGWRVPPECSEMLEAARASALQSVPPLGKGATP